MLYPFLAKLRENLDLTQDEASAAMEIIMRGEADEAQLEEYLVLLADKGETSEEIAGSAITMHQHSNRIYPKVKKLVDVVGTGGDGSNTFNISTTVAFVVAGCGVAVAKHGNKAVSSKCGAANVLEELGVNIMLPPEKVEKAIEEVGIGFLFAPNFHPAMKYAMPVRQKLGRKTIFNLLGPLTNPANTKHQLVGVADANLLRTFAEVLQQMNHIHSIVVNGEGLDEFTTTGASTVFELKDGKILEYKVDLAKLGIKPAASEELRGGDAKENAAITRSILRGEDVGSKLDIVVLNAAAALLAADAVVSLEEGMVKARESVESGKALAKLEALIKFSEEA